MKKEHLTKLLEKGVVVSPLDPHEEQIRERLTICFVMI